jgi:hypothetical protein
MQGALDMDTSLHRDHGPDTRTDAVAIAVVLATILVSALCYAFILHAGIVIAE